MKEEIRKIIEAARGDDLYRAQRQFAKYPAEDMDKPYGQSGKTPREILASYEEHNNKIDKCLKWLDNK